MKVQINHQYTYETDLDLKIGDKVRYPTASHLQDVFGYTQIGTVTSLTSDYNGYCVKIIEKVES
jgi:cell shape-determining protein MreC